MSFGGLSNYPPGVTGNEPQITGEYPCADCGAPLPESPHCPECNAGEMTLGEIQDERGSHEVFACDGCGHTIPSDFDTCPGGCEEDPAGDYDAWRDREDERAANGREFE
jgi:RNA polymerase subunit RPABC4/transcription elongation factor Spt4